MPRTHTVKDGDCLVSIAKEYDFPSWKLIYYDESNAELRRNRPDPFTLFKGDEVNIPDDKCLNGKRPTGKKHVFGVKPLPALAAMVHIVFEEDEPTLYAQKKYELTVNETKYEGITGSDGQLHRAVVPEATEGALKIWINGEDEDPEEWTVKIGGLDPTDTDSGVEQRIANLGLIEDDAEHQEKEDALKYFQASKGLEATGARDDDSENALDREGTFRPRRKLEYLEVGRRYRLLLRPQSFHLDLSLGMEGGLSFSSCEYELKVGDKVHKGRTDKEGRLRRRIESGVEEAELRLWLPGQEEPEVYDLQLEDLPDITTEEGVKTRLVNLGFLSGSDFEDSEQVKEALNCFQISQDLEVTGTFSDETIRRLKEIYGV